jgi:hypothetical protein
MVALRHFLDIIRYHLISKVMSRTLGIALETAIFQIAIFQRTC